MPKIVEYSTRQETLQTEDKGYAARETAGRRIGPMYNEAGTFTKESGRTRAELIKLRGEGGGIDVMDLAAKHAKALDEGNATRERSSRSGGGGVDVGAGGGGGRSLGRGADDVGGGRVGDYTPLRQINTGGPAFARLTRGLASKYTGKMVDTSQPTARNPGFWYPDQKDSPWLVKDFNKFLDKVVRDNAKDMWKNEADTEKDINRGDTTPRGYEGGPNHQGDPENPNQPGQQGAFDRMLDDTSGTYGGGSDEGQGWGDWASSQASGIISGLRNAFSGDSDRAGVGQGPSDDASTDSYEGPN